MFECPETLQPLQFCGVNRELKVQIRTALHTDLHWLSEQLGWTTNLLQKDELTVILIPIVQRSMCIYCEGYKEEQKNQGEQINTEQEPSNQSSMGQSSEGIIGTVRLSVSSLL